MNTKTDFYEAMNKARDNQELMIIKLARSKLIDKISGYDYYEEAMSKEGPVALQKHVPPSDTAIIFAIKNYENKIKEDSSGNKDAETMIKEIRMMTSELGINN